MISNDCPYAYYIHCFAHRLQLALVAASRDVILVQHFLTTLTNVVNIVVASCKHNEQLKTAQASDIAHMIALDELESGSWLNQIGTLLRARDSSWSSHSKSISSLMKMFNPTYAVLINIIDDGTTHSQWAEANFAYKALTSF